MKIIDIFDKIASFDYKTLPKKFKYNGYCYSWCQACEIYEAIDEEGKSFNLYDYIARDGNLNDEIEILEEVEDKGYEDIEELTQECFDHWTQAKKINALIRNQKKILERLDK